MKKTLTKRCERCGRVAAVPSRQRHCHERKFGAGSYCCWGRLVTERKETRVARAKPAARPQDVATAKMEFAQERVLYWSKEVTRAARMLQTWQRHAAHYARRASLTDEQLAAERAKRTHPRRTRRAMAVAGVTPGNGGGKASA